MYYSYFLLTTTMERHPAIPKSYSPRRFIQNCFGGKIGVPWTSGKDCRIFLLEIKKAEGWFRTWDCGWVK